MISFRWTEEHWSVLLIAAMVVLVFLGFARIYTVTNDLKHEQIVACRLRVAGRADTNSHDRAPLAAALSYLATTVQAAAGKEKDPAQKQATAAFGAQLAKYAAQVRPLPNPIC